MAELEERVAAAVKLFWETRFAQARRQGEATGRRDYGARGAVTGGAQLNGFIELVGDLVREAGLKRAHIHKRQTVLPGYFRPTKEWDLVIVADGSLLGTIEFKSQVGPSFGNNFNNRVEEAVGNSTDLWTAYREGAYQLSQRPWLGYLMLLEEVEGSLSPVSVKEPHFPVFSEFRDASYARRYELFCERLVRERLYDAACFILSSKERGLEGGYREPNKELGFKNLAVSLTSRVIAYSKRR